MNVAFLTSRIEKASFRQRVLQYIPHIKRKGFSVTLFTIPEGLLDRYRLFRGLVQFELVVLHRKLFSLAEWRILRRASKRLLFDFDDAIMLRDPNRAGKAGSRRRLKRFERTVAESDRVVCGNNYLKGWAERYRKDAIVIPTPVDMDRYEPKDYGQRHNRITIGWIGSASTLIYLEGIKDVLDELAQRYPNLQLKIVADRFFECKRMRTIKVEWAYPTEVEELKSFDIGVMPLTDDPWSKGKCAFKLIQYMAVGLPAVASPVGMNREVVKDGVNGFLARNHREWVEKLSLLIEDRLLRERLGIRARQRVKEHYSVESNLPKFIEVLEKTVRG